jgi:hypothetical protein
MIANKKSEKISFVPVEIDKMLMNQEVDSDFLSVIPNLALQKLLLKGLIKCWYVVVNSKLLGTVKLNSKKLFPLKKNCAKTIYVFLSFSGN